eukprot:GILK01011391.1.p1 GENE.GILK01011391.1~~GILK01011391.1.p1  ORF type:complete len:270 (-),score=22.22 GILK01011391.1:319-1104(-)
MTNLVFLTGASRGFGRAIALQLYQHVSPLRLVLSARDVNGLNLTKLLSEQQEVKVKPGISIAPCDLSDMSQIDLTFRDLFSQYKSTRFSKVTFIHNAGSLGPLGAAQLHSSGTAAAYLAFNVGSTIGISSLFMNAFLGDSSVQVRLINISSKAAIEPFKSYSLYCAGKAARDSYLAVVAAENSNSNLKTLNYAPGPMDTDMATEIRQSSSVDKDLRTLYQRMHSEGTLVSPEDSASKLVGLLKEDAFISGSHIDYYDLPSI